MSALTLKVIILSTTLGGLMGGKQLAQCYAYFFAAGCWTRFVGPSFATSSAAKQRAEGQLLAGHTRLHEFAEEARERSGPRLSYIPPLTLHNYTAAYCPGEVCSSGWGAFCMPWRLNAGVESFYMRFVDCASWRGAGSGARAASFKTRVP